LLVMGAVVRAEGRPVLSSSSMIVSAVVNIALDPVLIFGLGPIPAMGIAGAATATVIARGTGALILLTHFVPSAGSYRFRPAYFVPDPKIAVEIYRVATASMVRMGGGSIALVLANHAAASFGVIPLAVLGVLNRLVRFSFGPCRGLSEGCLPLVGYNFGAGMHGRVSEIVTRAGLAALAWGALCWTVFMVFPSQVMGAFSSESQFLEEGVNALRIFSVMLPVVGVSMVFGFFFQGIGRGLPSLVLASSRHLLFLIPSLLILPRAFGVVGLWAAFPVSDGLSAVLAMAWTRSEFRKMSTRFPVFRAA